MGCLAVMVVVVLGFIVGVVRGGLVVLFMVSLLFIVVFRWVCGFRRFLSLIGFRFVLGRVFFCKSCCCCWRWILVILVVNILRVFLNFGLLFVFLFIRKSLFLEVLYMFRFLMNLLVFRFRSSYLFMF